MRFFMFDASLKATNSYLQKRITFCRSTYVKKVMKLVAFIFEHPSYLSCFCCRCRICAASPEGLLHVQRLIFFLFIYIQN